MEFLWARDYLTNHWQYDNKHAVHSSKHLLVGRLNEDNATFADRFFFSQVLLHSFGAMYWAMVFVTFAHPSCTY